MPPQLRDNAARQRFEYPIDGGLAYVDYRREAGITTLTFAHVPEAFEGHGIGSAMARAVLEELRARGERVVPACGFIAAFIRRHPEFADLVAEPRGRSV